MPAVSQRVDHYLGGVSRQSDDKKLPGQVRECLNGYPDPTFGLTKRPGFKWIANLGTNTTYDSSKWFYIARTKTEKYIGCIKPASLTISGNGTSGATNKTNLATTSSGSGTGMTVDLTAASGVVTAITINASGSDYVNGETITISTTLAGTGSAVTCTLVSGDIDIWNTDGTACTVEYDYTAWVASTAYAVGDIVVNDSGKIYTCDTAGTSAGSGGPTGTGSNISDGSTQWDYTDTTLAQRYLLGARDNYEVLTVQDTSIITNNLLTVEKQDDPTFLEKRKATLVLSGSPVSNTYTVVLNGSTITHASSSSGTYSSILSALETAINNLSVSGLTVTKYKESLHLSDSNSSIAISATGGQAGDSIYVFQDQLSNATLLPNESFEGHLIKIINTSSDNDTYFAKFVADDGTSGAGHWAEGLDPSKSLGLKDGTMPHELVNTEENKFIFRRIAYTNRLVGDDTTNSHPSFLGQKINEAFYYNNRLGFLSKDNISMSQSQDFFNFYHTSAQVVTDADPIDLNCSTVKPATLHAALPTIQGLVLFSKDQQFLLSSVDGVLTPTSTNVRAIASYEMDTSIKPVDIGGTIQFLSKTPSYTRTFGMQTFGQDENPRILDIGRVVNEWVPATVDHLIASPQNQFLALSDQSSRYIYLFRTYNDGKENLVEAWFNWQLCGTVQTLAVDSDDLYAVTKQNNQFTLVQASLSQSPQDAIIVNNDGQRINPCMDLYATASSVVWDSTNELSKCYIPWNNVPDLTPVIVIKGTTATGQFIESGFTVTPDRGTDGTGAYFSVSKKNLTSVSSDVIVGWKYDYDITLPKTYMRIDPKQELTDFTASLTINRMKFALGLSGVLGFKLKSTGVRQGKKEYTGDGSTTIFNWIDEDLAYVDDDQVKVQLDGVVTTDFTVSASNQITFTSAPANNVKILIYLDEWYNLNPTTVSNTYLSNDIAIKDQSVVQIPIHQRTDNFQLRLFNDSPFPVSLNSMMWEGHYSTRSYRRS